MLEIKKEKREGGGEIEREKEGNCMQRNSKL
jgi:hypothetical protein